MSLGPAQSQRPLVRGRYRSIRRLGTGGMGVVYEAWDEVLERAIAFKQLRLSRLAPEKRKLIEALFEREYHTLVRLRHPRIVTVYDYGVNDEGPYYTMELLSGRDMQEAAPLPYREVCQHLRDVASALALLHAHGLVHRDVSPRNVRLTAEGRVKLLDFGALAPFGVASSVVGTPLTVAPELMRRMPLDQRTDLYGLGVLGYIALTGQPPFAARRIDDLPRLWRDPPKPPSAYVREVPAALDALLLSLLRIDPQARPTSAGAVIDPLCMIGELPAEEHERVQAEQSYLLSCKLVGREREQRWLDDRLARALRRKGAQVVIESSPGLGKTRLLHELSLAAQLRGMLILKADAQAAPEPFGVAVRLGLELLMASPVQARAAAGEHAGTLAQLSTALRDRLGAGRVSGGIDAGERRARMHGALHHWFLRIAEQRPLLLAVDNVQAADHDSTAFLAALGHATSDHAILLLVTQRTGDAPVAPESLRMLRAGASKLRLNPLSLEDCEALVGALFGDVPNGGRLARCLYERSAGHPGYCIELAQLLVRKGIVRYSDGTWVLPQVLAQDELPNQVEELITARLAGLTDVARELIELLSVDNAPASVARCLALSKGRPAQVYQALEELVREQILGGDTERYWFRQETQRLAVLEQMDEARRRERHLQLAQELLANPPRFSDQVAAAWHLLRGGEERRGADLVVHAAHACLRDPSAYMSTEQVVRALIKALEIYERQGRSKRELASLLSPLVALGFLVDGQVVLDHGERALQLSIEVTGLARAARVTELAGRSLGLLAGLAAPALEYMWLRKRGLDVRLEDAIRSLLGMIPAAAGAATVFYDADAIVRIERMIAPIALLGRPDEPPDVVLRFVRIQRLMSSGREREAAEALVQLAPSCRSPAFVRAVGEGHSRAFYGGMLYCQAIMQSYQFGSRALHLAREMESLGIQTWATAGEQVRLLYHSLRGESEQVELCRERVERLAMRGDSTWQMDVFLPALIADTLSLRQHAGQLARRAERTPSLAPYAAFAHAGYLSLRGDLPAAIAEFERLLPRFPPRASVAWLSMRAHYAATLNRAGEYARAHQLLCDALAHSCHADYVTVTQHLEAQRQLALAEAGLGNYDRAVEALDALLAQHGREDNPLLIGLLHKARAELALAMDDATAFREHVEQLGQRFRATKNPALIAQLERLIARAATTQAWLAALRSDPANDLRSIRPSIPISVAELMNSPDRCRHALLLVCQRTRSQDGWLYLAEGADIRLAASTTPMPLPEGMESELRDTTRALQQTLAQAGPTVDPTDVDGDPTLLIDAMPPDMDGPAHEIVMLTARRPRGRIVVGALVLRESKRAWLDAAFLEGISQALHERDTVLDSAPPI
jgi:tetratricopeptide (TPR) repeat protein